MAVVHRQTTGSVQTIVVDANPTTAGGIAAPIGSVATLSTSDGAWLKTGVAATAWVQISGVPIARQKWVTPDVGTAGGSGTIHDPILGLQNAIDSFPAPTNAAEEAAENVMHVSGGVYDEAVVLPTRFGRWVIFYYGSKQVGTFAAPKGITWQAAAAAHGATGQPSLTLASAAHIPGSGFLTGNLAIGDGGAAVNTVVVLWDAYVYGNTAVNGSMAGGLGLTACRTTFTGPFTFPTCDATFRSCALNGAYSAKSIILADKTLWGSTVTVTNTAPAGPIGAPGFHNCVIAGNFTGPAGTALFDKYTQDNFGGAFAGGAGAGDYLEA